MEQSEREYIESRLEEGSHLIPAHMLGGVKRYVCQGIRPGSFLEAVICNDLKEAFGRADDENASCMQGWVRFFYNYAPSGCWGSPDRFREWLNERQAEAA